MAHLLLIVSFALYYIFYLIISITTDRPSSFVADTFAYFMAVDTIFVLVALLLYVYSISLVKQAINQSSNYNFKYKKGIIMLAIYSGLIVLEGIYLLTFKFYEMSIIVTMMLKICAYIVL